MAAATVRRRVEEPFDIHEDARTEETEMMAEDDTDHIAQQVEAARLAAAEAAAATDEIMGQAEDEEPPEDADEEDEEEDDSSEDEQIESSVQADMDQLADDFPGFRGKYRLIKRIGEGMYSES